MKPNAPCSYECDDMRLGPDPYDPNGYEKQREARTLIPNPAYSHLGVDPHVPGAKLDQEKPRASLVLKDFSLALIEVCKVGTMGAAKYSDHGWLSVENGIERYESALLRHLLDRREVDDESGLLHAAHAAWNALAVLELKLRNQE
jgi:hypothetical protein